MSNSPSRKPSHSRVAAARNADNSARTWWIIGIVVVLVAAALGFAVLRSEQTSNDVSTKGVASAGFNTSPGAPADLVYGTVKVDGTALPAQPEATSANPQPDDPGVGKVVPTVTGQHFDGSALTIPSTGKPKVVMFVAHWCPHCQKEVPLIVQHLGGQLPADVDLFAVSTAASDTKPNFPPGTWLRNENWPVPTLVDDAKSSAGQAYGLSSFPYFVAVDASGKVVQRTSGEIPMEQLDALIASARSGRAA